MSSGPPIDFASIDTTVHGPVRLGVLTALQAEGELDFTTLKRRLSVADGALGNHLQKLEGIGYLTCTKAFHARRPKSTYRLTPAGREALFGYLETMQRLIDSVMTTGNRTLGAQPPREKP